MSESVKTVPLASLVMDDHNARLHSDRNIEEIKRSLEQFGQHRPFVVQRSTGKVIVGNGMYQAMKEMGITHALALYVDDDDNVAIKRALADNRTSDLSDFDNEVLAELLAQVDNDVPGWTDGEIAELLAENNGGLCDPDEIPEVDEDSAPVSQLGDLWLLGDHRLICGDSTCPDVVRRLISGEDPHLMVTDPPYGVQYTPAWRNNEMNDHASARTGEVLNDDRFDWREAWALFPGDVTYVWHAGLFGGAVAESLEVCGFVLRSQIVWAKGNLVLGRGDYHWQHETCWYAVRKGKTGHWQGDRTQTTLWRLSHGEITTKDLPTTLWDISSSGQDMDTVHGTQKPVECMRRPIVNNSQRGDLVYEPFCGSGTTLIACEMEGRKCLAIELNPTYVDVIIKRWEAYTGGTATLEETGMTFEEVRQAREV